MISQQILEYTKNQLRSGFTVDQIRDALKQQGWMEQEIVEIINRSQSDHHQEQIVKPMPQKSGKSILLGFGNLFTGILFLIIGVLIIMDINTFTLNILDTYFPTMELSTGEIMMWAVTGLLLLAGILNLIAGIKLMKKE